MREQFKQFSLHLIRIIAESSHHIREDNSRVISTCVLMCDRMLIEWNELALLALIMSDSPIAIKACPGDWREGWGAPSKIVPYAGDCWVNTIRESQGSSIMMMHIAGVQAHMWHVQHQEWWNADPPTWKKEITCCSSQEVKYHRNSKQ